MRLRLGLTKKIKLIFSYYNLFKFNLRKKIIGFEYANDLINTFDKNSLKLILKSNGASIGSQCDIESGVKFHNCKNYNNLIIGSNCHIGKDCFFDLKKKIIIGNNVVIAMKNTFITHIDLGQSELGNIYSKKSEKIIIKDNSYIGCNSTILMGVIINKYVFIAAGSVVNKNINAYILGGGVPIKKIKEIKKEKLLR